MHWRGNVPGEFGDQLGYQWGWSPVCLGACQNEMGERSRLCCVWRAFKGVGVYVPAGFLSPIHLSVKLYPNSKLGRSPLSLPPQGCLLALITAGHLIEQSSQPPTDLGSGIHLSIPLTGGVLSMQKRVSKAWMNKCWRNKGKTSNALSEDQQKVSMPQCVEDTTYIGLWD